MAPRRRAGDPFARKVRLVLTEYGHGRQRAAKLVGTGANRNVVDSTRRGAARRRQVTRTLTSLEAARAFVAEVHAQVESVGRFSTDEVESVSALCERWLTSRRDVRPVTAEVIGTSLR